MEASASDGHGSTPHGPMPQIAGFMREDHQTSQAVMIPKVRGFILRISVLQLCLRKKALRGCHLWSVSPLLQSQFFFVWLHAHVCVLPYLFHVSSMPHGRSWKTVCPWNAINEWILSNKAVQPQSSTETAIVGYSFEFENHQAKWKMFQPCLIYPNSIFFTVFSTLPAIHSIFRSPPPALVRHPLLHWWPFFLSRHPGDDQRIQQSMWDFCGIWKRWMPTVKAYCNVENGW